jgi:polar amino acid transport system permease protein
VSPSLLRRCRRLTIDILTLLWGGAAVTAKIAAAAAGFALLLAVPLGLGRASAHRAIRLPCVAYIEFFRGTSLVVQLFWLYYVLPPLGVRLNAMTVAILGIALNYGAYGAEVVRGAIRSVPDGQVMAARALGLSPSKVLLYIVTPQAMTIFIRPWGNLMIQLLKATSLVSLITIAELTYRAYQVHQLTMRTLPIFGTVLVIYFVMAQCIALATHVADAHFGRWRRHEAAP